MWKCLQGNENGETWKWECEGTKGLGGQTVELQDARETSNIDCVPSTKHRERQEEKSGLRPPNISITSGAGFLYVIAYDTTKWDYCKWDLSFFVALIIILRGKKQRTHLTLPRVSHHTNKAPHSCNIGFILQQSCNKNIWRNMKTENEQWKWMTLLNTLFSEFQGTMGAVLLSCFSS